MDWKITELQKVLGVTADGKWGPQSQAALDHLIAESRINPAPVVGKEFHHGKASSFADPADIKAFRKCKDAGGTDQDCFRIGDNGIGCYGDDVSEGSGPSCALPPEDSEEKWGTVAAAKHKGVEVTANGKSVLCVLKDRMPHRANIKNGAIIDLNPDAAKALGVSPPFMIPAAWRWV